MPILKTICHSTSNKRKNNTFKQASANSDSWNKLMRSLTLLKGRKTKKENSKNPTKKWLESSRISKKNLRMLSSTFKRHKSKSFKLKRKKTKSLSNLKTKISHYAMELKTYKAKFKTLIVHCQKNNPNSPGSKTILLAWRRSWIKRQKILLKKILSYRI